MDAADEAKFWREQELLSADKRATYARAAELLRVIAHAPSDAGLAALRAQVVAGTGQSASALELSDPTKAVAFYGQWLTDNATGGTADVQLRGRVSSLTAQLYATSLGDARKALEVYDWSLALLGTSGHPIWQRLAGERDALIRQQRGEGQGTATVEPVKLDAVTLGTAPRLVAPATVTLAPVAPHVPNAVAPTHIVAVGAPAGAAVGADTGVRAEVKAVNPLASALSAPAIQAQAPLAVAFDASNARRDAAMAQIKLGKLAPDEAWQSGALNYANIADFFQNQTGDWVIVERASDNGLHHKLLGLLLKHEGEKFQTLSAVPLKLRVWLADYHWTQRDSKAVEVVESVLSELTPPDNGPNMMAYQAVERMAWYYRDTSQPQQSADAWDRWNVYEGSPIWTRIDVDLEMARELEKLGPHTAERVAGLRQSAVAQNDGWRSALVFYDQYLALMKAGKPEEARRALGQPLHAVTTVADGRVAQNTWLAVEAYRAGDLTETLRLTQEALAQVKSVDALEEKPAKTLYGMARELYIRAGGWKNQPIQTDTKEVVFQANPSQPDQPLYARFRIKTYGDKSVTASVDNPNIQARVLPVNNWQREGMNAQEEEMEVIIQSNSLNKFTDVPLTLSGATRGKTTTVRLSLGEKSA